MQLSQLAERLFATGCGKNSNKAVVLGTGSLVDKPAQLGSLHQSHNRVVPLLEKLREVRDGGPTASREAGDAEQQLMLLGSDPAGTRHPLAEP